MKAVDKKPIKEKCEDCGWPLPYPAPKLEGGPVIDRHLCIGCYRKAIEPIVRPSKTMNL